MEGAVAALQGAVDEMDRRFKQFAQKGARNIELYNQLVQDRPAEQLPFQIVIVDELADLMMVAAGDVEHAITRLAQMARATGIHLILATQRPSVDVVTGLIKANFPARISFSVTSQTDSRVVLDTPGAEKLLGRGDMLYMASDSSKLFRLQGCYVSDRELEKLVTYWRGFAPSAPPPPASTPAPRAKSAPAASQGSEAANPSGTLDDDQLLSLAIQAVKQNKKASVSFLQRKLRIGYSRAARLMQLLEEQGIVGPDGGPTKGRQVLDAPRPPKRRAPRTASKRAPAPRPAPAETDEFADWTEADWEDLDKA